MIAAPAAVGNVLIGKKARKPTGEMLFRFYGTRDVVLGLGALRAASSGADGRDWLVGGIAADLLDAAVILAEWDRIPERKRLPGVLVALGAAGAGAALLARG